MAAGSRAADVTAGWAGPGPAPWLGGEDQPLFSDSSVAFASESIDWVARGAVTTPISQGRCGTCAQFSATANIEGQWHLAGHPLVPLAVQEMVDCSSYTGPYGMGWVSSVHHGLDIAADYPLANHSDPTLKGCRSPCNTSAAAKSFAKIDGATCLPPEDYSPRCRDRMRRRCLRGCSTDRFPFRWQLGLSTDIMVGTS
jgi:hypothetical protein